LWQKSKALAITTPRGTALEQHLTELATPVSQQDS